LLATSRRSEKTSSRSDRVFAATGIGLGAHAEYVCLRAAPEGGAIATMPSNLSYEEAATVPYGAGEALRFLRKAEIRSGQKVIDYTREDFTDSHEAYDVIFDVVRNSPSSRMVRSLRQNGAYLTANPGLSQVMLALWTSIAGSKRVILGVSGGANEDLTYLKDLVEAGKIRPVIDRHFPLDLIAEAHKYAESGLKLGNIVISIA
jgi:NADPH:quinone reductase-like Zn-dependent oxidoreductase